MWRCHKCGKPVYFAERKQSLGYDWHPECLRCEECGKRLNPGQHAEHKGVPYCHVPCYGALFGPQLFGHGTRVESHKSFGQKGTPVKVVNSNLAQTSKQLETKLKAYNQFHDGRSGEIRSREVNGRLVLEGALRIHWGVKGVIHLKENDDQRTVVTVRKRNSCRYSVNRGNVEDVYEILCEERPPIKNKNKSNITSSKSDTSIYIDKMEKISLADVSISSNSADSGNQSSGSVSITPTPPPSPAIVPDIISSTLPSKLNFNQMDWDELDQLLQVERNVDDSDKPFHTLPNHLPSQSSVESTDSISLPNSESVSSSITTLSQSSNDSISESKVALLPESDVSSDNEYPTIKPSPKKLQSNSKYILDFADEDEEKTLRPSSDVDLLKLLNRNDLMPLDKEVMSRSFNDDTLKANSPIDPKKINDSLKLYGDIVKNITERIPESDNFSVNCENKLEEVSNTSYFNEDFPRDTFRRIKKYEEKISKIDTPENQSPKLNSSAYNRAISMDNSWIGNFDESNSENYELSRSISGPEHFNNTTHVEDSASDNETINYAHPVDDYIIIPNEGKVAIRRGPNSRCGSTAIKRRTGKRRQRAAALRRRCSINGHFYNRETSFFTPPYGSLMSVWVTSLVSTQEVINLMLDKYKVDSNAQRFALFVVRDNGEQRKLRDEEYPLLVRVNLGPHEEISQLFLMDADKTGEISSEVAQFLNLTIYECEAILQMYHKEEQRQANMIKESVSWRVVLALVWLSGLSECGEPTFDPATLMRLVLVPADAAVGSVIYRIRAHDKDFDYPLQFDMIGDTGRSDVSVETLPCTRYNSVCQANVILQRRLDPGRYIDFRVSVRNTKGRENRISCSITATNATTPRDTIFPHIPALIMVPEDARRGTDLDYIVARKNPLQSKAVYLELWGSPLFAIRQKIVSPENTEGTIFLIGPLDFETQSMYHLTVLATDAYAEPNKDTRNIAGLEVVVVVQDVQDMPPVFTSAPPVTHLSSNLVPGDIVVRVHAEDGDKGAPRQIRYGLVSEGNPFTTYFNINETSGDVTLERPLDDIAAISHVGTPILLTVIAEEVKLNRDEPEAMSATVELAFIMPERGNSPPYFENDIYIARVDENSPQGTALIFTEPYSTQVSDDDAGKNGVFSLTLLGNNGTFEISPSVGERRVNFLIKVRDSNLLDYEARHSVNFQILAQELGPATNLSATANVTVYLNDVNDNPPFFLENLYEVDLPENATAGTRVVQIRAEDVDTGIFGKIQYTAILGYLNTSLHLDPRSGIITVAKNNHGFDREAMPDVRFLIEARDNEGIGNRATVPLVIKLLDVNDEAPVFERPVYEFILASNLRNFTSPAFIKAIDKDAEPPNNIVRYELILGNFENKFSLNEVTGELYLLEPLKRSNSQQKKRQKRQFETEQDLEFYVLTARAYDLGVPLKFSMTTIKVYPPESKTRTMLFVVPGLNPDRQKTEEILSTITGGKVTILEIRPYKGTEVGVTDVTSGSSGKERSVVVATVLSAGNSLVDVSHIQQQLNNNKTVGSSSAAVSTDSASVTIYKAENKVLFWLLIFLAICITMALICLILCCICEGCPLYMPPRKRVIRVNSTDDDVHLVVREKGRGQENKSVQAAEWYGRKEAWSAGQSDSRTKATQWKFNKRNNRSKDIADLTINAEQIKGMGEIYTPTAANDIKVDDRHSMKFRDGPNVIYTKDMQDGKERYIERNIYVDDIDQEYTRITNHRNHLQTQEDMDADSIMRHEMERGSEADYLKIESDRMSVGRSNHNLQVENGNRLPSSVNQDRDQMFIKEGNTEILRLVTRDGIEEERYVNLPASHKNRPVTMIQQPQQQYVVLENGKDILMKRFIADQGDEAKNIRMKMERSRNQQNKTREQFQRNITSTQYRNNENRFDGVYNQRDYQNIELPVPGSIQPTHQDTDMITNNNVNMHGTNQYMYSSQRQDLIETSLRQQNELLRQILLEKSKIAQHQDASSQFEAKLETQSLPGHAGHCVIATQTDCHISTQTEPYHLRPARRKARSDIDESYSEEEYEMLIGHSPKQIRWVKRKRPKKRKGKYKEEYRRRNIQVDEVKRKIRTPILEETEVALALENDKHSKQVIKEFNKQNKAQNDRPVRSALKKDVLLEISNSLDNESGNNNEKRPKLTRQSASTKYNDTDDSLSDEDNEKYNSRRNSNEFTDDSLEGDSQQNKNSSRTSSANKDKRNLVFSRQGSSTDAKDGPYLSHDNTIASDKQNSIVNSKSSSLDKVDEHEVSKNILRTSENSIEEIASDVLESQDDHKTNSKTDKKVTADVAKSVPRYMQWYNNKTGNTSSVKIENQSEKKVAPSKPKRNIGKTKNTNEVHDVKGANNEENKKNHKSNNAEKSKANETKKSNKGDPKEKEVKSHPRLMKEEKVKPVPEGPLPDTHPLLQHSEHRYEREYQNQNPMCFVQPTHLPQYLGMQPQILTTQAITTQPLYINQIPINTIPVHCVSSQGGLPTTVYLNHTANNENINIPDSNTNEAQNTNIDLNKNVDSKRSTSNTDVSIVESNVLVRHTRVIEDDDSGIAMTSLLSSHNNNQNLKRLPITEKQSVFTIAYNDVQTKQLRPDSSTPSF